MAQPSPRSTAFAGLFTQVNSSGIASANNNATDLGLLESAYALFHGENSQGNTMGSTSTVGGQTFAERTSKPCSDYRNSLHVSQGGPTHPNFGEAGLLEDEEPLAIATFWAGRRSTSSSPVGGMTLATAMDGTVGTDTIDIDPPLAAKPANTPAYYPIVYGQFLDKPANTWTQDTGRVKPATSRTITSDSTNAYVSWVRIEDEILGLTAEPTIAGGKIRITVRRGMWGTTPAAHAVGARVFTPAFVGKSSGIAASDDQYSGIPTKESVYQLRYTVKQWQGDQAFTPIGAVKALGDAIGWLARQFEREANNQAVS